MGDGDWWSDGPQEPDYDDYETKESNMADAPIFVEGLRVFKPREGAPDFVKGSLLIGRDDRGKLIEWLAAQPDGDIKIDVKESKKGTWYTQLNTWKKPEPSVLDNPEDLSMPSDEIKIEDLPF